MQASVTREGEIVILHLSGRVDVETAEPFRKVCLGQLLGNKVVFDFRSLGFVGSSGILPFLETLQEFANRNSPGVKFSGAGVEFKKVFAATTLNVIENFETHQLATHAFLHPQPRNINTLQPAEAAPILGANVDIEAGHGVAASIPPTAVTAQGNFGLLSFKHDAASEMPAREAIAQDFSSEDEL
jgi:anti-anti-sigma factor